MHTQGIIAFGLALIGAGWMIPFSPESQALDFTWNAGPDVATPLFNSEDADAGVVQDGPNLWVQTALYPTWSRYLGTTLDNLVQQPDAVRDASFTQPNGDDAYWTDGLWQDRTGKRYAIIHIEYDYAVPRTAFLWKRRIGLATSTDQGAHWHYVGDILTTNPARPGAPDPASAYQDFGCGDTYLDVDRRDGFFYLYYMTAWVYSATGWRTAQVMSVARCAISDLLAPGKWSKWSGGTWTQPGLGGVEDAVFSGTDAAVIHFNLGLGEFVAIGHDSDSRAWISSCTSLAVQDWQPRDYTFPQRLYWYNWPVDPVTHDRYEIGQNFRLYSAQADVNGVGTKYFNLTFSRNGNIAPTASVVLPEESYVAYAPGPLSIVAVASDADGSVAKVEYFANQVKIGEVDAAPYVFNWSNVVVGNYRLAVRATDNLGAVTESAGVDMSVQTYSFVQWKTDQGLDPATPGTTLGADGLPILLNYALNINSASGLPAPKIASGKLTLSYSATRPDVSYSVERSTDLATWTTNNVDQGTPAPVVTASTPLGSEAKIFLHLRVNYP